MNTISQAREAAQEIFGKHQRHEVTFDLSGPEIMLLKEGAEAIKGTKAPKGSRLSEWAATITSTVQAVEAIDDKAEQHTCRMWDVGSLMKAAAHAYSEDGMTKLKGAYDLLIRLRDLPMTSPYYEAATTAEEKINKLEREEARLLKLKETLQREITEINDQLEGEA